MVAMIQAASILRSRPTAKDEWAPPNCLTVAGPASKCLTVAGTATLGPILSGTIKRLRCARRGRALVPAAGHQTDAEKNGEVYVFIENQWDCKEGACWRQPGFQQSDDEPVVCVSWHDRKMFCRWLSQEAGRLIRLPSEAEWDYACRAGSLDYGPAIRDEMAWHGLNSGIGPAAAGQEPNPWGLLDNVGNRMHPVA